MATGIAPFDQTEVTVNMAMLTLWNQQILGSVFGSTAPRVQIPLLLRLQHEGKIQVNELVTKEYSIDEVNQGYLDLEAGLNVRGVVKF